MKSNNTGDAFGDRLSKSLLNMPKNPIRPDEENSPRVSSAAVIWHFPERSSGAENMKCYFRLFFKAVIFSEDKHAHGACLRKNTTTLQEGGTLTQGGRFRSEHSLILRLEKELDHQELNKFVDFIQRKMLF